MESEDVNKKKFEREVKSLIYFVREYGIQHTPISVEKILKTHETWMQFAQNVHHGFYLAQKNVVRLLTKVLTERKQLKSDLKDARRNKLKEEIAKISNLIEENKYQEMVFRKVMDAIAWQLFHYDVSVLKKLYGGEELIDITDSNLESELFAVDRFLEEDPSCFVLISDLTTFIQVGDLIVFRPDKGLEIYELKDGEKNKEICDLLKKYMNNEICLVYELSKQDMYFIEQFSRTIKQVARETSVINTINTGKGRDLYTGLETTISQTIVEMDCFVEKVRELIQQCNKKNHAIGVIEGCLLIGIYKQGKFPLVAFEAWKRACDIKVPTYNMRYSLLDPLTQPIFLLSLPDNAITDIIMGRIIILMTLNLDDWLETFVKDGYTYHWMNKKQTSRVTFPRIGNPLFKIDGRGIMIKNKQGAELMIGDGPFVRMFSSFYLPSSIRKYQEKVLDETHKDEEIDNI